MSDTLIGNPGAREGPPRLSIWLTTVSAVVVGTGMAYSLWWPSVVRHAPWYWLYPGDIWGTVRAAHWIGWGGFSFIYSSKTGLVTLPGFHMLLTPVVMLCSALGLSETAPGLLPVPKPTSWLVIGPAIMAVSAVALFGLDSLARSLGVSTQRRRFLSVAEAAAVWPTIVYWGHPEDVAALGFLALSLSALLRKRFLPAGCLLGAALAMQLYVVAVVPLFLAVVGVRKAAALVARASVIPGFLLIAVVVPNPRATLHALMQQPNFPKIDFPTPWVHLAPSLGHGVVAAGPGRVVGLVIAIAIGIGAARFRPSPHWIIWLAGIVLAIRCLTESVMDPYYVMPAVGIPLVIAIARGKARFAFACVTSAGLVDLTYFHIGEWWYWIGLLGLFGLLYGISAPSSSLAGRGVSSGIEHPVIDENELEVVGASERMTDDSASRLTARAGLPSGARAI